MMKIALGLGSSLGNRRGQIELALRQLNAKPGIRLLRTSRLYRTPPMKGGAATGWFLNAVALFDSSRSPHDFLDQCVALERASGRRRAKHWGDRPLDLDLLLAENWILDDTRLTLPHPGIAARPFVLIPLLEVWPDARDPRTERKWAEIPKPQRPHLVRAGILAAGRPPLYLDTSNPSHTDFPQVSAHEDLHRHRQHRPNPRSAQLGHPGGMHDQPVADRP